MYSEKYQLIFYGKILPEADLDQVKQKLGRLFKTGREQIEKLFGGSRLVIKDNLDYETALKYQSAIRQQGAECELKKIAAARKQALAPKAEQPLKQTTTNIQCSAIGQVPQQNVAAQQQEEQVTDYWHKGIDSFGTGALASTSIAPPGVELVKPVQVSDAVIQTNHLSVAESGATLAEPRVQEIPQIETGHFELVDEN